MWNRNVRKKFNVAKKESFIKKNKILIIFAAIGIVMGMIFGILGTVSKDVYEVINDEKEKILSKIIATELDLGEDEKQLEELENKETELIKQKEELIEKEKQLSEENTNANSDLTNNDVQTTSVLQ